MKDIVLSETGLPRTDEQAIWSALSAEVEALILQGNPSGPRAAGRRHISSACMLLRFVCSR